VIEVNIFFILFLSYFVLLFLYKASKKQRFPGSSKCGNPCRKRAGRGMLSLARGGKGVRGVW